jgi:hypothetical protein
MAFDPRQSNPIGIILVFVTIAGLFGALFIGSMVAHNEFTKIGALAAIAVATVICLTMGKNIWLLIPLGWMLTGKIQLLPLPFSVRDLCVFAAFGTYVGLAVFKKLPKFAKFNSFDKLMLLNLAYLATVYLRNPVGTRALGSEMVGGKPYLDVATAVLAYWVLQHITITVKESRWIPWLMAAGSTAVTFLGMLTKHFTFLVPYIAPLYSGIDVGAYMAEQTGTEYKETRQSSFFGLATLSGVLMSFFRPLQLLLFLRPFWSIILYATIAGVLLSGFRTGVIYLVVLIILNSYFYGGMKDVVRLVVMMLLAVFLAVFLQTSGFPIPPAAQRSLSFIPAPWDADVKRDAETSTKWRLEMWQIALQSDKYIRNKILGDGFGFSTYELQIQLQQAWGGKGYIGAETTEAQLVTGAYHSGPISSIRYVGVIGLIIFTITLFACAKYAWSIIRRSTGTPFFPLALFIGVPLIYKPVGFLFVFGAYEGDLPAAIVALAFLNLTVRGLASFQEESGSKGRIFDSTGASRPATPLPA